MGGDAQQSANHQKHSQSRPHGWEPTRGIDVAHTPQPATLAAYQTLRATKIADTDATWGAQIGVNLLLPNGKVAQMGDFGTSGTGTGQDIGTTDDVLEGIYNLYFTAQRAQDAVGGILTDTATIDFTYNQTTHSITADLKDLANSGVGAALVKITRDAKGRLSGTSAATTTDLTEGANLYFTKARVRSSITAGTGITIGTDGSGNTVVTLSSTLSGNELTDWTDVQLTDWTNIQLTDWAAGATDVKTFNGRVGDVVPETDDYSSLQVQMVLATLATLPSASANLWKTIVVTDLTGGAEACLSDGTNWRRYSDRSIAS